MRQDEFVAIDSGRTDRRSNPMADETLHIHITNDPVYAQNGMVVHLTEGGPCWLIDPGLTPQGDSMVAYVQDHSLRPAAIVLTHAHADHIGGIDEVCDRLGPLPVHLAKEEWKALTDPNENLSAMVGAPIVTQVRDPIDLAPGDTIELGATVWEIRDTSGHSPGGRTLYCAQLGIAIVGDALFAGSIGRVDFPHSDGERLMHNIHENLMSLPDETRVLSGHGPETTIGRERTSNPFVLHGL